MDLKQSKHSSGCLGLDAILYVIFDTVSNAVI